MILLAHGIKIHFRDAVILHGAPSGCSDRAILNGFVFIRNDQRRIDQHLNTKTGTFRTGAEWIIERKASWCKFFNGDPTVFTGKILRIQHITVFIQDIDNHQIVR